VSDLDWRLRRELMALRGRFRELMERAVVSSSPALSAALANECPVDVWESETEVIVEAELPGASRADIQLRIEGDTLVLAGELPGASSNCGRFLHAERPCGQLRRAIKLPSPVGQEPRAVLRDGVLEVRLPKTNAGKVRIHVEGSSQ
jgi:HSP20 family protein